MDENEYTIPFTVEGAIYGQTVAGSASCPVADGGDDASASWFGYFSDMALQVSAEGTLEPEEGVEFDYSISLNLALD